MMPMSHPQRVLRQNRMRDEMFGVITAFINLITGIITTVIGGTFRIVGGCLGSIALGLFLMLILAVVVMGHVL